MRIVKNRSNVHTYHMNMGLSALATRGLTLPGILICFRPAAKITNMLHVSRTEQKYRKKGIIFLRTISD